jgi:heme O synthase-like polyprenyltransferase
MSDVVELNEAVLPVAAGRRVGAYLELTKMRIIGLVLVVVAVGAM